MTAPQNMHQPALAGDKDVAIIGTKEIDTGLRELQAFGLASQTAGVSLSYAESSTAGNTKKVNVSASAPSTLGVKATGSITTVTKAEHVDGETLTIGDGINTAVVFEFDVNGTGVTAGRVQVNISGATTANDIRDILITVINRQRTLGKLLVLASNGGAATVTLTADIAGTASNVTITETVADTDFVVSGLSGGVNPAYVPTRATISWYALGK